ncbi:hypothetical protein Astex_0069 [Asticcacaulis excentricus CB 48]|uniref:Uncharacterized protein n=2 Tax=Asticcacaulis excentricus TaxID=78587 RepID=E8RNE2_ASTEC|nr:hypothetical protein Astex_0069 [Asticcacaulis excentricus CB 48]
MGLQYGRMTPKRVSFKTKQIFTHDPRTATTNGPGIDLAYNVLPDARENRRWISDTLKALRDAWQPAPINPHLNSDGRFAFHMQITLMAIRTVARTTRAFDICVMCVVASAQAVVISLSSE